MISVYHKIIQKPVSWSREKSTKNYTYVKEKVHTIDANLYYRPPRGGRLFDMKVVSSYVFLRTYYV